MPSQTTSTSSSSASTAARPSAPRSWLQTPKPIRILFSYFPVRTLPANRLPARTLSATARKRHTLFIFTTAGSEDEAAHLVPSFNPTCLKWQTYLLIHEVGFGIAASSNHASPSGSLPFLIPAEESFVASKRLSDEKPPSGTAGSQNFQAQQPRRLAQPNPSQPFSSDPVAASKLQSWVHERSEKPPAARNTKERLRCEVYLSLIEHRIRPAWLHCLYLTRNFDTLAVPLYIHTRTTSSPVRLALAHELRRAARAEILKTYPAFASRPDQAVEAIYAGAESAFEALSSLLRLNGDIREDGEGSWFFGTHEPGLLDASVFAYTFLLLDNRAMGRRSWAQGEAEDRLRRALGNHKSLVRHTEQLRGWVYE